MVYKKQLNDMQKLVLYFVIYSFLGWILETIFALFVLGKFVKRGFLYGFGAVLIILTLKKFKGKKTKEFFISMIVFSVFEYVVSWLFEMIFHLRWWDYSNDIGNINGRISIAYSVAWGVIGLVFNEKIHPFIESKLDKAKNKMSYEVQKIIVLILPIAILTDFILSSVKYLTRL